MASENILEFAEQLEANISGAIATAQAEYDRLLDEIEEIYTKPGIYYRIKERISREQLVEDCKKAMRQEQQRGQEQITENFRTADFKMRELKNDAALVKDMLFLNEQMQRWRKRFEDLSIPAGRHTGPEPCYSNLSVIRLCERWLKYCTSDRVDKDAADYESYTELNGKAEELEAKINRLTKRLREAESEYTFVTENSREAEMQIITEYIDKDDALEIQIKEIRERIADTDIQAKITASELNSYGYRDPVMKDRLLDQMKELNEKISLAKTELAETQAKRMDAKTEFERQKEEFKHRPETLQREIADIKNELRMNEAELEKIKGRGKGLKALKFRRFKKKS